MVIFNTKDYNMLEIMNISNLRDELTSTSYRVHGLKDFPGRNYDILLRFNKARHAHPTEDKYNRIQTLFSNNGIRMISDDKYFSCSGNYNIYIGLNRHIRADVPYCVKVLKTLIYGLEDRIEINPNFVFTPKFTPKGN